MPYYDYKCLTCEEMAELEHKMSESPQIKCAKCGLIMQRQITSNYSVHFKGTGFYCTDYKK